MLEYILNVLCFFMIIFIVLLLFFIPFVISDGLKKEKKEIICNSENFVSYEYCTKLFDVWYCKNPIEE